MSLHHCVLPTTEITKLTWREENERGIIQWTCMYIFATFVLFSWEFEINFRHPSTSGLALDRTELSNFFSHLKNSLSFSIRICVRSTFISSSIKLDFIPYDSACEIFYWTLYIRLVFVSHIFFYFYPFSFYKYLSVNCIVFLWHTHTHQIKSTK